jgi:hypothetical protein
VIARKVVTTGAVAVVDYSADSFSLAPPVVVGDSPQWADDSDATYAELETFEHPDASNADNGIALLAPNTSVSPNSNGATVTARVRYQSMSADMAPPWVRVKDTADMGYLLDTLTLPGPPGSSSPTWVEIPLGESTTDRLGVFLDRLSSGSTTLAVEVYAPFLRVNSLRYPRTRIFEVQLIVRTQGGYAPPCRILKRGDRADLGGARNYPPAKSQQFSSRGVGFY